MRARLGHNLNKKNKRIVGILGGTFDPPHDGHKFISNYAILKLNLNEVWWVVSKNPFKPKSKSLQIRRKLVKKFLKSRKIKYIEIEPIHSNYAIDSIKYLKSKFKSCKFIWLMGTDNLYDFHLWKNWRDIFYNIPIAIFDRPSYSFIITKSKALLFFRKFRIKKNFSKSLNPSKLPSWAFISGLKNNQSSSYLRKNR